MILKNGLVMDETFTLRRCDLKIENGVIADIAETIDGDEAIDLSGCYVLPGFIDSHLHGAMGCIISDPEPDLGKITHYEAIPPSCSLNA